jgi:hypothetical protein
MLPHGGDVTPKLLDVETPINNAVLEAELKAARELLATKDSLILDLREDRDHWRETAQTALRQLPAPSSRGGDVKQKKSWWPF